MTILGGFGVVVTGEVGNWTLGYVRLLWMGLDPETENFGDRPFDFAQDRWVGRISTQKKGGNYLDIIADLW